jgi:UDP-N-acetylglucosamine acyltransferase
VPIHPTAIIAPAAKIHPDADVGPYVVIDGAVRIGARTRVMAGAYVTGWTEIGEDNVLHPGAVIGHEPQDLAYRGAETYLRIGHRNVFREHSQVHRGTKPGSATVIGDDNYLMHNAHVAHNCTVGNRAILASGALVAGHCVIEDGAFISGNCVVHQHVRVGRFAVMRGLSRASRDVPPFCIMDATHTVRGTNVVGLRRAGFDADRIRAIRRALRTLFGAPTNLRQAMARVEADEPPTEDVTYLLAFIRASKRGMAVAPRRRGVRGDEPPSDDDTAE